MGKYRPAPPLLLLPKPSEGDVPRNGSYLLVEMIYIKHLSNTIPLNTHIFC